VKPRPVPANAYQRPFESKLEIKLAVVGRRWLEVERAMGIENSAGAHQPDGIMRLQARQGVRAIFV